MREKRGMGDQEVINSKECDFSWKNYLSQTGQADLLLCVAYV